MPRAAAVLPGLLGHVMCTRIFTLPRLESPLPLTVAAWKRTHHSTKSRNKATHFGRETVDLHKLYSIRLSYRSYTARQKAESTGSQLGTARLSPPGLSPPGLSPPGVARPRPHTPHYRFPPTNWGSGSTTDPNRRPTQQSHKRYSKTLKRILSRHARPAAWP